MNNQHTHARRLPAARLLTAAFWLLGVAACTKMDDTYHDFWADGEKTYPSSPDSLRALSGHDRVVLQWIITGDPNVTRAVIYWNAGKDSLEVPVERDGKSTPDSMSVNLDPLPEGAYTFDLYTYDDEGHRSVLTSVAGKSYGDNYANSLLQRLIEGASFINDTLYVDWGDPADQTSVGVELQYTDTLGNLRQVWVDPLADSTVIADYALGTARSIEYRTLYLPDSMAVDTFATAYAAQRVKGPRMELPKDGWSATASSYDNRNGRTDRTPEKAIDNDNGTSWVNLVGSSDWPHTLTLDLGSVMEGISGLSINLSQRAEAPKTIQLAVSDDGAEWTPLGSFSLNYVAGTQYIDFSEDLNFRFIRVTGMEAAGNSPNIVINEVGLFVR